MAKKFIYVFEGPAGCGKSSLIQAQLDAKLMVLPQFPGGIQIERPRNYGEEAPLFSHLKDSLWAAAALLTPGSVAIDRWVISQLVYDYLRSESGAMSPGRIIGAVVSSLQLLEKTRQSLKWRGADVPEKIQILFHFILLDVEELGQRREVSGLRYPFPAGRETRLYHHAFDALNHRNLEAFDRSLPKNIDFHLSWRGR